MTSAPRRAQLEDDLRSRGLPLLLLPQSRRHGLVPRSGPVLLAWAVALGGHAALTTGTTVAIRDSDAGRPLDASNSALLAMIVGAALVLAAPVLGVLAAVALRRRPVPAAALAVVSAIAVVLLTRLPWTEDALPIWLRVLGILVVVALTYLGLGSMTKWAGRRVTGELGRVGPMVSRVLPLLMLSFLFLFFNAEIWQVMANLSTGRTWAAAGVLALLCLVLAAANIGDALGDVLDEHEESAAALTRAERVNVHAVGVLITLIQATVFATLVFIFFVAFGALTISRKTAKAWITAEPTSLGPVMDAVGVTWPLVQVCLVLSSLAALSFIASVGADAQYRDRFVDPLIDELREGIEVRSEYHRLVRPSAASADPPEGEDPGQEEPAAPPSSGSSST